MIQIPSDTLDAFYEVQLKTGSSGSWVVVILWIDSDGHCNAGQIARQGGITLYDSIVGLLSASPNDSLALLNAHRLGIEPARSAP
jgi:hypothetical protein